MSVRWKSGVVLYVIMSLFIGCGDNDEKGTIQLSQTLVSFDSMEGSDDSQTETIAISNIGNGILSGLSVNTKYESSPQSTGWLKAELSGTSAPTTLVLQATSKELSEGIYEATIDVSSAVATNSPQSVIVTFSVESVPLPPLNGGELPRPEQPMEEAIKRYFAGRKILLSYRDGGPIYGTYFFYEIHYCDTNRYEFYAQSIKQTVLDNEQINNWADRGSWAVFAYQGIPYVGHRLTSGEVFYFPVKTMPDGRIEGVGCEITLQGNAICLY